MKVRRFAQSICVFYRSFNSRTREGATVLYLATSDRAKVSIHAPVKVRHIGYQRDNVRNTVSIHAPVKVRLSSDGDILPQISFNSRTREGATFGFNIFYIETCFNSRTREGATKPRGGIQAKTGFNSRTREGATLTPSPSLPNTAFQFTHP